VCLYRKGVQHLRLKLPSGQLLDVFNTHLQALEFISKVNRNDLPAIFAGDFNRISEIAEYSIISGVLLGFTDVWASVNPGDPGYTWDPFTNYYAKEDHEESTLVQRIDYILVRNGKGTEWRINRAHLALNSPMPYKKIVNETFASDHFAVTTELELHSK
jgi:endonuclease/exonuclease/phosphatase family metal-dependent hydrolase